MYLTSLLVVVSLLALYSVKYSLNYLSARPVRNNPIYATWSTTNNNLTSLYLILSLIYIRNPLSLIFLPLNLLTNSNLVLDIPILLIFALSAYLLFIS